MLGGLFEQRAISFQTLWGSGEDKDSAVHRLRRC